MWLPVLLYMIPEGFLNVYVGYTIIGVKASWKRYFWAGLLAALITPLVRALIPSLGFGWHTVIYGILFMLVGMLFLRAHFRTAFVALVVVLTLILIGENLTGILVVTTDIFGEDIDTQSLPPIYHTLMGWSSLAPVWLLAIVIKAGKLKMIPGLRASDEPKKA